MNGTNGSKMYEYDHNNALGTESEYKITIDRIHRTQITKQNQK